MEWGCAEKPNAPPTGCKVRPSGVGTGGPDPASRWKSDHSTLLERGQPEHSTSEQGALTRARTPGEAKIPQQRRCPCQRARAPGESLAGSPRGLVLTFKSLSDQERSMDRQRDLLGKTWLVHTPVPSLTGGVTPGKAGGAHLPGFRRTGVPEAPGPGAQRLPPPPPPPGDRRPQQKRGHSLLPPLSQPGGLGLSPPSHHHRRRGPPGKPTPAARLPTPGPPPSPSPAAQRCSPIVRSPEPGLLGAPSRGAGPGPGWGRGTRFTAASQRSSPSRSRRRRLAPWLRRRHLTTEVTHSPLLLALAAAPPPLRAPPLGRVFGLSALGLDTISTMGGSLQARGQIPNADWLGAGSGPRPVKRLEAEMLTGRYLPLI